MMAGATNRGLPNNMPTSVLHSRGHLAHEPNTPSSIHQVDTSLHLSGEHKKNF